MSKQQLCELIPHEGNMSLLDSVEKFDENQIICLSSTHKQKNNPLRESSRLGCVNGIEYGAQAIAVHGGLMAQENNYELPRSGFLVQVKELEFTDCDLSALPGDLTIQAQPILFDQSSMIYTITIEHKHDKLMQGRLMIVINR